ncbi:MAG: ABC transporter ATP-binding protein, partial [Acidobacteria bacterium]|nr:ABC transporter ATP-binding protein [Acidobacteriota bacterium]
IVLLGASGSGKSTLLNIIGGLDVASEGELWFHDRDLAKASERELTDYRRRHVGFVVQFYNLIPSLTVRENVQLVTDIAEQPMPVDEAVDLVGLTPRRDHFPAQLSGGEQQRVALARAFAPEPSILLADEPTGNLDSATGEAVLNLLTRLWKESRATLVLVTHDQELAVRAERRIHLRDGRIHLDEGNA